MSQEIKALDWGKIIEPEKFDSNHSFEKLEEAISPIINTFIPLEKVKNVEHKRRYKPWITHGICTSIKHRDKILSQLKKEKNTRRKSSLHCEYKALRNSIVELTKKKET